MNAASVACYTRIRRKLVELFNDLRARYDVPMPFPLDLSAPYGLPTTLSQVSEFDLYSLLSVSLLHSGRRPHRRPYFHGHDRRMVIRVFGNGPLGDLCDIQDNCRVRRPQRQAYRLVEATDMLELRMQAISSVIFDEFEPPLVEPVDGTAV